MSISKELLQVAHQIERHLNGSKRNDSFASPAGSTGIVG